MARNGLLVVACGDGHIYSVYSGLGSDLFVDVAQWDDMVRGHVGVGAFLFVNRMATVAGVFGSSQKQSRKRERVDTVWAKYENQNRKGIWSY